LPLFLFIGLPSVKILSHLEKILNKGRGIFGFTDFQKQHLFILSFGFFCIDFFMLQAVGDTNLPELIPLVDALSSFFNEIGDPHGADFILHLWEAGENRADAHQNILIEERRVGPHDERTMLILEVTAAVADLELEIIETRGVTTPTSNAS
jgi:hypothetical protein